MTAEEDQQVRSYIQKLEVSHAMSLERLHKQVRIKGDELKQIVAAMTQIEKMAKSQTQPLTGPNAIAVIEHYCPDYGIPF